MSKLYIVTGLGGTGKTTLARALSRKLDIVCLHKDSIKAAIHDELGVKTQDTFKVFFRLAEEQIANGVDLIIEAWMLPELNKPLFESWEREYGVEIISLVCTIDPETRKHRILSRERHECHEEADKQALDEIEEFVDYSGMPGEVMELRTDVGVEELVGMVDKM